MQRTEDKQGHQEEPTDESLALLGMAFVLSLVGIAALLTAAYMGYCNGGIC